MKTVLWSVWLLLACSGFLYFSLYAADQQAVVELETFLSYCEEDPAFWQCTEDNLDRARDLLHDS